MAQAVSDFERLRLENIARNEEFLRSIGLAQTKASISALAPPPSKLKSNERFSKRKPVYDDEIDHNSEKPIVKRRSSRLNPSISSNINDQNKSLDDEVLPYKPTVRYPRAFEKYEDDDEDYVENEEFPDSESTPRQRITVNSLRQFIINMNEEHSDMISNKAISHCVMRVSYMSNQALFTRINSICRGAGKQSMEKILVFYYALLHSGLHSLADIAKEGIHIMRKRVGEKVLHSLKGLKERETGERERERENTGKEEKKEGEEERKGEREREKEEGENEIKEREKPEEIEIISDNKEKQDDGKEKTKRKVEVEEKKKSEDTYNNNNNSNNNNSNNNNNINNNINEEEKEERTERKSRTRGRKRKQGGSNKKYVMHSNINKSNISSAESKE